MKSFYIMNKNRKVCKVIISGLKVQLEKYSDKLSDKQFPTDTPTIEEVYTWIEERCFPASRANKKNALCFTIIIQAVYNLVIYSIV